MLPVPIDQVTEALLQGLCDDKCPESGTLDFKHELPRATEEGRDELRKDVCAMANADGGDLVYGISTRDDCADRLNPITAEAADAAKRRLLQALDSQIEPRVTGLQVETCRTAAGGYVLILRVPASLGGPHRHGRPGAHRFVFRDHTRTVDMTYDHLRNAFGQGASILARVRHFRADRLRQLEAGAAPERLHSRMIAAVHFCPLNGIAGRVNLDMAELVSSGQWENFNPYRSVGVTKRLNLEGLLVYPEPAPSGQAHCLQVFRDGSLEVCQVAISGLSEGRRDIEGPVVSQFLRASLASYLDASKALQIEGPMVGALSIVNAAGSTLATRTAFPAPSMAHNLIELPEIWVESLAMPGDLDSLVRPTLDVLYQGYGVAKCDMFTDAGQWRTA